ncbi:hypothetical protein Hanom_Chr12g01138061 [Helianthus anomalus]
MDAKSEIETEEKELTAVLTSPLSLDNDSGNDYRAPNLLQRVFSLLKIVRPGSDLTRFTVLLLVKGLKLMDQVGILSEDNKYQNSMPSFEGFNYYIPPLCGNILV